MGTYPCRMKGCVGSGSFTMEQGEEEWHMQKFGHLPTNCPACRAFKKAQTDVDITCSACDFTFTVTAQQIIGWHIHNGIWNRPNLCKLCEEDPNRAQRKLLHREAKEVADRFYKSKADHPRQHLLRPVEKRWFRRNAKRKVANAREYLERWIKASQGNEVRQNLQELSRQWGTTSVQVAVNPQFYQDLPDPNPKNGTRYNHVIGKHYNEKHLDALDARSPDEAFLKLGELASSKSSEVVEFRDAGKGYLVKYDTEREIVVIIHDKQIAGRNDQPPPPPAYIVTAYNPPLSQVAKKMQNQSGTGWVPNLMK